MDIPWAGFSRPARRPCAVAKDRRRLAVVTLERAREVQRIAESGHVRDLAHRAVGEAQQPHGFEHHTVGDELLRGLADDLRQRLRQRRRGHRERVGVVAGVVIRGEVALERVGEAAVQRERGVAAVAALGVLAVIPALDP